MVVPQVFVQRLGPGGRDGATLLDDSAGNGWAAGISVVQGSGLEAGRAVRTVKSVGMTSARSDHATGNDTGVPGRIRGL